MTVATLKPAGPVLLQSGVSYEQAMEAHRLSNEESLAVPTIAERMGIDFEVMCKLLYGRIWPAAYQRWSWP